MAPEIQATLTMDTIYRLCLLGGRFKFHNESVRLVEWRRFISQRICRTLKLTTRIIPIPKRHRASKAPEARMTRSFIRESLITTKKTALFCSQWYPMLRTMSALRRYHLLTATLTERPFILMFYLEHCTHDRFTVSNRRHRIIVMSGQQAAMCLCHRTVQKGKPGLSGSKCT